MLCGVPLLTASGPEKPPSRGRLGGLGSQREGGLGDMGLGCTVLWFSRRRGRQRQKSRRKFGRILQPLHTFLSPGIQQRGKSRG